MKNTLNLLRNEIDVVDKELIELLSLRMKLVKKVGILKQREGLQPLDQKRWSSLLESKIIMAKKHNLDIDMVRGIYELIHKSALRIESLLINKTSK